MPHAKRQRFLAATALLPLIHGVVLATVASPAPAHAACAATGTGTGCDGPDDVALASPIDGAGGLAKAGTGTVTLSGANDVSGGTRVDAGTLLLVPGGRLGASNAALVVQGGTLDLGGTAQGAGPVVLTAGTIRNGTLSGTIFGL